MVAAVEKDAILDALKKSARQSGGGAIARAPQRRIFNYKVRTRASTGIASSDVFVGAAFRRPWAG